MPAIACGVRPARLGVLSLSRAKNCTRAAKILERDQSVSVSKQGWCLNEIAINSYRYSEGKLTLCRYSTAAANLTMRDCTRYHSATLKYALLMRDTTCLRAPP